MKKIYTTKLRICKNSMTPTGHWTDCRNSTVSFPVEALLCLWSELSVPGTGLPVCQSPASAAALVIRQRDNFVNGIVDAGGEHGSRPIPGRQVRQ